MKFDYDRLNRVLTRLDISQRQAKYGPEFRKDSFIWSLIRGQSILIALTRERLSDRRRRQEERDARARIAPKGPSNPLRSASRAIDWIPLPKLRKAMKKLVADQAAHVLDLEAQQRFRAAKWIKACTWVLLASTAVTYLASKLLGAAKKVRSIF